MAARMSAEVAVAEAEMTLAMVVEANGNKIVGVSSESVVVPLVYQTLLVTVVGVNK